MTTYLHDSRLIELEALNPTRYQKHVVNYKSTRDNFLWGFGTAGLYYTRLSLPIPGMILSYLISLRWYYRQNVHTVLLEKRRRNAVKEGAWKECRDLSLPLGAWKRKWAFWFQATIPFFLGMLLARKLFLRPLHMAVRKAVPPQPHPVSPKEMVDSRVY